MNVALTVFEKMFRLHTRINLDIELYWLYELISASQKENPSMFVLYA